MVEVMIATALTLIMVAALAQMFHFVTEGVADSRALVEMVDRLRQTKMLLQEDLSGITAPLTPPLHSRNGYGYFELIEGPIGPVNFPNVIWTTDPTTLGDYDDVLMFTARNMKRPYQGMFNGYPMTSPVAEVCWFLRGTTLYRRVFLTAPFPGCDDNEFSDARYVDFDVSLRSEGSWFDRKALPLNPQNGQSLMGEWWTPGVIRFNTLADLTLRQNRFAHQEFSFPYDARIWSNPGTGRGLGLPVRNETRHSNWPFPTTYVYVDLSQYSSTSASYTFDPTAFGQSNLVEYWPRGASQGAFALPYKPEVLPPGPTADPYDSLVLPSIDPSNGTAGTPTQPPKKPIPNARDSLGNLALTGQGDNPSVGTGPFDIWDGSYFPRNTGSVIPTYNVLNRSYLANQTYDIIDIAMTNVVEFDVKVWDPGAPVFELQGYSVGPGDWSSNNTSTLSSPANSGWSYSNSQSAVQSSQLFKSMLQRFVSDPLNNQPIGFGAYVDLNYMDRLYYADNQYFLSPKTNRTRASSQGAYSYYPEVYDTALKQVESAQGLAPGTLPRPQFGGQGDPRSGIGAGTNNDFAAVYDTWALDYETDGVDNDRDGVIDEGTNGVDENGLGGIDDPLEVEVPPPYPYPIRSIQIKMRVIEQDTRQVREITLIQDFGDQ